jgi:predicted DNA-binding transcriptional regulator AlpA
MAKRRSKVPELMGVSEVAECLGIKPPNLYGNNAPKGLPEPVRHVRATKLWLADDIREFKAHREAERGAREEEAEVAAA